MEIERPSRHPIERGTLTSDGAPAAAGGLASEEPSRASAAALRRAAHFLQRRGAVLWWLHSAWALGFGLIVMWAGSRDFTYLRIVVFHIAFIWMSSLWLPAVVTRRWLSPAWCERLRLATNYFNKNFYQQLLFFLLPVYYASTTAGSRNMVFLILLGISAVLSTLDVIYDRYLSTRWSLTALFFVFNLFAAINVMLPVLWSVSNHTALRISAVLALAGFASMLFRLSGLRGGAARWLFLAAALFMLGIVEFLAPYIPPAPLRLASAAFGRSVVSLEIGDPLDRLPAAPGQIIALTAIQAPMGLEEQVRHRWVLDGKVIFVSGYHSVTGGRSGGYRLWTQITWMGDLQGRSLWVDVETRGGQLVGRARLSG